MTAPLCDVTIGRDDFDRLMAHLFPGDHDEHGAVLKAGVVKVGDQLRFVVREVVLASPGIDYVAGKVGYRALHPTFIHRTITQCRDEKLAYLAVHNHGSDTSVAFSDIDLESHERGYPALSDIGSGVPVGALVFGHRSAEADIWLPDGGRLSLRELRVLGPTLKRLYPKPLRGGPAPSNFDRQIRMFGSTGQALLENAKVAVIGLGGIGSLVNEYLSRLGVGHLLLIDPDRIDETNLSRVVGATVDDVRSKFLKVDIAARVAAQTPACELELLAEDVAKCETALRLRNCDYIFLAADSMRARLVFNALVHQYLIPGVQLGAKVRSAPSGGLEEVMSAVRHVRPGDGCLWCNQFIDPAQLAIEAKTDQERKDQAYGTSEPNPSVITLNAVSAAHSVNDFLLYYLGIGTGAAAPYKHFHFLEHVAQTVVPRKDGGCRECGLAGRYARGDGTALPCTNRKT